VSDEVLIDWLRAAAPGCEWTASVCTGAGLYAAAGLLEGKTTTTHWGFRDNLRAMGIEVVVRAMGIEVVADRVVWQGDHISGAGVSAGIDLELSLTERVHGRELAESLQPVIEYDPQRPFQSGSLRKPTPARCARQCGSCWATVLSMRSPRCKPRRSQRGWVAPVAR
jgi:cyclohexyl-isocyanide hydratase